MFVFPFYVSYASRYAAYGIVGGVLLVLIWLYYSCIVLLFGAVVNVVLAGRSDHFGSEDEPFDTPLAFEPSEESGRWRW